MKKKIKPQSATWKGLASSLGVSTRALQDWRKLLGAPTTPDLDAWLEFVEAEGLGRKISKEREALLCKRLVQQIRKDTAAAEQAELELAKRKGQLVEAATVGDSLARMAQHCCRALYRRLEHELPPRLVGLSASQLKKEVGKTIDSLLREYKAEFRREFAAVAEFPEPQTKVSK